MNISLKTIIYLAERFKKSIIIMAGVLLGIILLLKLSAMITSSDYVSYSGLDFTLGIYVFVYFIAIFTESFNHLSMYGITRKKFFVTNSIFIVLTSIFMVFLGAVFFFITKFLMLKPVLLLFKIYTGSSIFGIIVVAVSLSILCGFIGWLFSLLTYKFGKYMIFVLIFVPQILLALISMIVVKMNIVDSILKCYLYYIGITANKGTMPFVASLNFILTAGIVAIVNWLLIKKIPIKV